MTGSKGLRERSDLSACVRGVSGRVRVRVLPHFGRVREQHCFRSVSILEGEAGALKLLAALSENWFVTRNASQLVLFHSGVGTLVCHSHLGTGSPDAAKNLAPVGILLLTLG